MYTYNSFCRLISTQHSPPVSPKSAPISPLNTRDFFPHESISKKKKERGVERPWKQAQTRHQRSHTVKYHQKVKESKTIGPSPSVISGPTNFTKADPEDLYCQLINGKRF